jgi:hypothetical protein
VCLCSKAKSLVFYFVRLLSIETSHHCPDPRVRAFLSLAFGRIIRGVMDWHGIDCRNEQNGIHTIQIPPPKLFDTSTNPLTPTTGTTLVALLCPMCMHVYEYTAANVHQRTWRIPDQDLLQNRAICVAIEFLCGYKGCQALLKVHGIKYGHEATVVLLVQLRNATFHVACLEKHTPRFEEKNLIHTEDIGPFSPF